MQPQRMRNANGLRRTQRTRCRDRGVLFLPIVYTAQGAVEPEASKSLEVIHRAAAENRGQSLADVRAAFAEEISVAIVRANARAARRRDPGGPCGAASAATRHVQRVVEAFAGSSVLRPPAGACDDDAMETLEGSMADAML